MNSKYEKGVFSFNNSLTFVSWALLLVMLTKLASVAFMALALVAFTFASAVTLFVVIWRRLA